MASTHNPHPPPFGKIGGQSGGTEVGSTPAPTNGITIPPPIRKLSSRFRDPYPSYEPSHASHISSHMGRTVLSLVREGSEHSHAEDEIKQDFKGLGIHLLNILSGMYGLLIVTLGAVLPVAETFAPHITHPYIFETYYVYLYLTSVVFMTYVYLYLLRKSDYVLVRTLSRKFRDTIRSLSNEANAKRAPAFARRKVSEGSKPSTGGSSRSRRRRALYHEEPNRQTGSFYLRIGTIVFGAGTMIHSGLNVGHYFEIRSRGNPCSDVIQGVKPVMHLLFTFAQMYFIFMNSKLCVNQHKSFARFGFVHMSGTNICVWLRAIVVETLFNMRNKRHNGVNHTDVTDATVASHSFSSSVSVIPSSVTPDVATYAVDSIGHGHEHEVQIYDYYGENGYAEGESGTLPELQCNFETVMGRVLGKSVSYLYPCIIQFSLICACVMYVMWHQVGLQPKKTQREESMVDSDTVSDSVFTDSDEDDTPRIKPMSVDCSGSSRGLFLGLFLLVMAVVMLVCFFVLTATPGRMSTAALISHLTESIIYLFALVAVLAASWQMREMRISRVRGIGLDQTLIFSSLTGLIAFAAFNIVAAVFSVGSQDSTLTVVSNLLMFIQACTQAVFLLAAMHVKPAHTAQALRKPGKQWVTFLLVSNFALWALTTFGTQHSEHNHLQEAFYGRIAWSIFCHVSVPLGIYYRFHSSVCLSNIWKNAWKVRQVDRD